jgi:hypothetical protein
MKVSRLQPSFSLVGGEADSAEAFEASFTIQKAGKGTYTATATNVTASGDTWITSKGVMKGSSVMAIGR